MQTLRFSIRQFRKSPGFAFATIFTLALGIGATTAIFSLVNAVILRPLPFPGQDRLLALEEETEVKGASPGKLGIAQHLSYPDFFDWRAQNHSFEGMACYRGSNFALTGSAQPEHLNGEIVSANFFRVLGVHPLLGRDFRPQEETPGTRPVVVSNELWRSTFGASPDLIGRSITLDDHAYTVVGVMAKEFSFPIENPAPAFWTTLATDATGDQPATSQRGFNNLRVIGRLKPGLGLAQARADLTVIARHLAAQYPDTNKNTTGVLIKPELESLIGDSRPALQVLFTAVTFLLLITCANVAGLLLARVSRRGPEIALRVSLGASRAEIMRQVLIESVFLAVCGGVLGIALSSGILRALIRFVPEDLPRIEQISVDASVLVFVLVVSVLTGLLFGVAPAWRMSRVDPSAGLREGGRSVAGGQGQHRLHNSLVIVETAIGLVLLIGSGLLIRSFMQVLRVNPGFDPRHVLTGHIDLPDRRYSSAQQVQFYNKLLARLAALPGVESAGAGWPLPLSGSQATISFEIEGRPTPPADEPVESLYLATQNYFQTLRIPIVAGRAFTIRDDAKSAPVVIVNQKFARKYFPGENPIGKRIKPGIGDGTVNHPMRQIVGVAGDCKRAALTAEVDPGYYLPFAQAVITSPPLAIRTAGDPVQMIAPLRAQIAALDKNIPLFEVSTLENAVVHASAQPRFQTLLLTCFAVLALLLSAIGLYAVLSYMVVQRTVEIGLRMAVGAEREDVLLLILRRGLTLAITGVVIGFVLSALLTRSIRGMLYGVQPFDPLTFIAVAAILFLVSMVASSLPAWRAARLDPVNTLRHQ